MKSFEEIWHSRNPQHELNADTGKDMFWGTAQLCAEEFCSQASDKDKEIERLKGLIEILHNGQSLSDALKWTEDTEQLKEYVTEQWKQFAKENNL